MKEKFNQLFKDKLFLVMLVLGLLTIVAAAGVVTIQRGRLPGEENPYIQMEDSGSLIAEESPQKTGPQTAGASDAQTPSRTETSAPAERQSETEARQPSAYAANDPEPEEEPAAQVGTGIEAATPLVLDFTDSSRMAWPVRGNVLLDYSMDSTIYFPTLKQYQCSPAIVIQGEVSDPVAAPADARVMALGVNEEIGNYVMLDLGNDYVAVCGQLKEIPVVENEYLEAGQILGYIAEPTKYYSVEGSNLYFELRRGGETVDPLDYLE